MGNEGIIAKGIPGIGIIYYIKYSGNHMQYLKTRVCSDCKIYSLMCMLKINHGMEMTEHAFILGSMDVRLRTSFLFSAVSGQLCLITGVFRMT
jgi:hypothetical protein